MKSIVKFSLLFLMFVFTLLIMIDIMIVDNRKNELKEVVEISLRNVLKAKNINRIYDVNMKAMNVELVRNIVENTNTDSDIRLKILESNEKGLIDVVLTSDFIHMNGQRGDRTIRKSMLVEEYKK